ncbi:MAG: helicase-related protein, partial [Ktedonobacterales bacterium]
PRVRLAIFDDVGLGTTIEAGLIVTELMARQLASRMLVICPANLREQWREQLSYFFHLVDARIFSSTHRRALERELPAGANPWEFYRCLIVSEDYAKEAAIRQQILEQPWDIVLIDEAHTLAKPHQSSEDDRVDMDRWHLAEALSSSPRVRHLLLLTATPHNGYSDSFASLLRMLDVGAVEGPPHAPHIHREIARKHICQRTRRDLRAWFEREGRANAFPQREQLERTISPSAAERAAIDAADAYGGAVLRDAEGTPRQVMAYWAVMHLHKRALSSPAALRISLKNRRDALQRRLKPNEGENDAVTQDTGDTLSLFAAQANVLDNDPGERLSEEETGIRVERGLYALRGDPRAAIHAELRELERVIELAEKITPAQDSKLQWVLRNEVPELLRKHPRVIIFSRYRDTMAYVADQIERSERFRDVQVIRIDGSLSEQQRREAFAKFEKAAKAILVATDAISEGINLQHACCQMIHWELPWNPNRLEQRVGRIDRFGQPEPEVRVRLLVMDDTLDGWSLKTLVQKAQQIRADYGFAPPYFGDETSILDLLREKGIRVSLLPRQLSLFEQASQPTSSVPDLKDPFSEQTLKQIQAESFYGATDVTVPDIERRLRETEAAIGSPADIQTFVQSGLQRFGCTWTPNADGTVRVAITDPNLLVQGMDRIIEHATFNPQAALDDPDLTLLDLGHPLVRRLMDVVKDSAFDGRSERYGRTAYLVTPDVTHTTALLHVLARYVVGTETPTIVEELIPVAYHVYRSGTGADILPAETTRALLAPTLTSKLRADDDVRESLSDALRRPDLDEILRAAVEERRRALVSDRQQMLRRDVPAKGAEQRRWLHGIDDLTIASYDVLTATIYYPPVG